MEIIKTIDEAIKIVNGWKNEGKSIGLVPTMGYLHEGHESLIKKAILDNDKVVVSIFVNPLQFAPSEDLETYPRNIYNDSSLCSKDCVDFIFAPEVSEMYFKDVSTYVNVTNLTDGLCGRKRPGHFQGVCTVVTKLFNIIRPDRAYFGEKDAQQLAVIKRMTRDLSYNVEIVGCPIIREWDGLAKSSRNYYLSQEERQAALVLSRSLSKAKESINSGLKDVIKIKDVIVREIEGESLATIDYVEIVDAETLEDTDNLKKKSLIAIAVYIGKTRLIDNLTI